MAIKDNLAAIQQRIAAACKRAGRDFAEVTLVAVSKTFPVTDVEEAIAAGLRVFGENRIQEAAEKIPALQPLTGKHNVQWHLIGHLQSNKARRAVELFDAVQTVDSLKLAQRLNDLAGELGKRLPVFLEVNVGGESAKAGIEPSAALELCEQVAKLSHLELRGWMTVPPFLDDADAVRPYFQQLRALRDEALRLGLADTQAKELSMGMSNDFEVAIEEGATFIRIGTALFGARDYT